MKGIYRFRGIFDKNTQEDVREFFSDRLIIKLWPGILMHLNEDLYYQDNQAATEEERKKGDLTETNCKITKQFKEVFNLGLPKWWLDRYPSQEVTLQQKRLKKL